MDGPKARRRPPEAGVRPLVAPPLKAALPPAGHLDWRGHGLAERKGEPTVSPVFMIIMVYLQIYNIIQLL